MKTLLSTQLAQQALATEARLLAGQQQVLLLARGLREGAHLSRRDLLDLLFWAHRHYGGSKYGSPLYKLLRRTIVNWLLKLRRRL